MAAMWLENTGSWGMPGGALAGYLNYVNQQRRLEAAPSATWDVEHRSRFESEYTASRLPLASGDSGIRRVTSIDWWNYYHDASNLFAAL